MARRWISVRPNEFSAAELDLIKSQFNVITPENSMKPGPVHPQENTWNWTQPEALVAFCQDNNIKIMGHTLVWHSQTNPWFFQGADRDLALARLKDHIHTLVGRFKGKISGWDVVNEAINDGAGAVKHRESSLLPVVSDCWAGFPHAGFQVCARSRPRCGIAL